MDEQLIEIDKKITELFDGSESWKNEIYLSFYSDKYKYIYDDISKHLPSPFIDKSEFIKLKDDLNKEIETKLKKIEQRYTFPESINFARNHFKNDHLYEEAVKRKKVEGCDEILLAQQKLFNLFKKKPIDGKKWFDDYNKLMNERMNLLQTRAELQ